MHYVPERLRKKRTRYNLYLPCVACRYIFFFFFIFKSLAINSRWKVLFQNRIRFAIKSKEIKYINFDQDVFDSTEHYTSTTNTRNQLYTIFSRLRWKGITVLRSMRNRVSSNARINDFVIVLVMCLTFPVSFFRFFMWYFFFFSCLIYFLQPNPPILILPSILSNAIQLFNYY